MPFHTMIFVLFGQVCDLTDLWQHKLQGELKQKNVTSEEYHRNLCRVSFAGLQDRICRQIVLHVLAWHDRCLLCSRVVGTNVTDSPRSSNQVRHSDCLGS